MRRLLSLAAGAVLAAPITLHAQAAAPTGLRRGGLGIEAYVAPGRAAKLFIGLSPRMALVAGASFEHTRLTATRNTFPVDSAKIAQDAADLTAGVRTWLADTGAVRFFHEFGALVHVEHLAQTHTPSETPVVPGVYGQVGASAFILPRLSLNASAELDIRRERDEVNSFGNLRGWDLAGTLAQLSMSVYF